MLPSTKGEAGAGRRRAHLDRYVRSGVEADALKTKALAQRRLHHRALLSGREDERSKASTRSNSFGSLRIMTSRRSSSR